MRVQFDDLLRSIAITDEPGSLDRNGWPALDLARMLRLLVEHPHSKHALRRLLHERGEPMIADDDELARRVVALLDRGALGLEIEDRALRSSWRGEDPIEVPTPAFESNIESELHWLEVVLIGEDGEGIAGVRCRIELPDGRSFMQTTDRFGLVRLDGITDASECTIDFPDLDHRAWEPA